MKKYLLGMDLGTTNIKAVLFDEEGTALSSSASSYPLIFPGPDMVEQDAGQWWAAATEILTKITSAVGKSVVENICGISVSSQIPTLLPLDREGNILRNALIWMDKRAAGDLEEILAVMGVSEYVRSAGAQPDAAFLPCKIRWFKRSEPALFAKTHRILQANSYINYKLTGNMTMDLDTASLCQCLDLRTLRWSEPISKAIGVDLNAVLPQPSGVDEVIGTVTEAAARQTGLKGGIPVVAGASDATASMYATGISRVGEAAESAGTTSLLFVGHDRPTPTDISIVARPCALAGIPYLFNAPINTTGASIQWYLENLGQPESDYAATHGREVHEHLNQFALQAPAGCNGLLFFPYMLGERAPLWNSFAKGMFIGLSLDTKRQEMIRAIFEGTGFALRHVIDTIREAGGSAHGLRVVGGGAKNRPWCRIKASILHMPVYILDDKTGDVPFGDALIAGHAAGVYKDLSESAKKLIKIKEIIEPVEEWSEVYDRLYPFYIGMYRHLENDLRKLKDVMDEIHTRQT